MDLNVPLANLAFTAVRGEFHVLVSNLADDMGAGLAFKAIVENTRVCVLETM